MVSREFLYRFEDEVNRARHEINEKHMANPPVGWSNADVGVRPSQNAIGWLDARLSPPEAPSINPHFAPATIETKVAMTSAIDRIKAKALQARDIAPQAIRDFESDLDGIIGEKAVLASKRAAAVSPHKEAIAGIYGEFDGLKAAMDLLTNGGPSLDPLPGSETGSET